MTTRWGSPPLSPSLPLFLSPSLRWGSSNRPMHSACLSEITVASLKRLQGTRLNRNRIFFFSLSRERVTLPRTFRAGRTLQPFERHRLLCLSQPGISCRDFIRRGKRGGESPLFVLPSVFGHSHDCCYVDGGKRPTRTPQMIILPFTFCGCVPDVLELVSTRIQLRLRAVSLNDVISLRRRADGARLVRHPRKVDTWLPGKVNSNSHGARPVY